MSDNGDITYWMQKSWCEINVISAVWIRMLDILSAGQSSVWNQNVNLHKICKMSCCHVSGHSWLHRQNWHSGTQIKEKIREIICTTALELDFKYGGSVCLETTEDSLQMWQTEVSGDPWIQSQLLHGFCISCGEGKGRGGRITPTNHLLQRASKDCNTAWLHTGALQANNHSHAVISIRVIISMETKRLLSSVGLVHSFYTLEDFCDLF